MLPRCDGVGSLREEESEAELGNGEQVGAFERSCDHSAELAVRRRVRGDDIDRTSHPLGADAMDECAHRVSAIDPRNRLFSSSDGASHEHFEWQSHHLERSAVTEHDPDPGAYYPGDDRFGFFGCTFPIDADAREEVVARRSGFVHDVVEWPISVVPDRRGTHEDTGRLRQGAQDLHQLLGGFHSAVHDDLLGLIREALAHRRCPREMHNGVCAHQLGLERIPGDGDGTGRKVSTVRPSCDTLDLMTRRQESGDEGASDEAGAAGYRNAQLFQSTRHEPQNSPLVPGRQFSGCRAVSHSRQGFARPCNAVSLRSGALDVTLRPFRASFGSMRSGLRIGRAGGATLAAALAVSACKKDERPDVLDNGIEQQADCADIPLDRLPTTGSSFDEERCEFVRTEDGTQPLMQRGRVTVPLGPGSTETIEIAVARVFTDSENPKPDPVVYLDGGPGGPSIASADWLYPLIREMAPDRDVIFVDQRGVGRSRPALNCTEDDEEIEDALTNCYTRLSGVTDLDEFDTVNNATDFDLIRQALGYEEWNLLGISYGTRLGLTIMRDHPDGVRAALIDSVVPLHRDILAEIGLNGYQAMLSVFAACEADLSCGRRYPDPMGQLLDLVPKLNENPVRVGGALLPGDYFLRFVFELLYSPFSIALVPRMIDDAANGDFEVFEALEESTSGGPPFSFGMHLSLHCAEEVPFTSREEYERFDAGVPVDFRPSLTGVDYVDWCEFWPVEVAPPEENEPVVSDIPTLVMAGEFDPVTPPSFAEAAHEYLTNSTYVLVRNDSHGASFSECGTRIARQFFERPGEPLEVSCANQVPGIDFLSTNPESYSRHFSSPPIDFATEKPSPAEVERIAEDLRRRLR